MLTKLETRTLQKLANGQRVKQVAASEGSSHSAVDKRIGNIKRKLNAKTLCEAIYKAAKAGLICALMVTLTSLEIEVAIDPDFTDADMNRSRYSRRVKRSKKETDLL